MANVLEIKPGRFVGRVQIYTDAKEITRENVCTELKNALIVHDGNRVEEDYLYWYRRGYQPILKRTKQVRPEICNKVRENNADAIVTFKVGYSLGKPIQYGAHTDDQTVIDKITTLNDYMMSEGQAKKNKLLADWAHVCGVGYKMALPNDPDEPEEEDEAPFEIYVLDPRYTFVVRSTDVKHKIVYACTYAEKNSGETIYTVYTKDRKFTIKDGSVVIGEETMHIGIPIIEYPLNANYMGVFEPVMDLLDAINLVDSNRLDGIEQFVQALLKMHNVDISDKDYDSLLAKGCIKYKDIDQGMTADVDYIINNLPQQDTQTVKDDLLQRVLEIVGMPNRNGGSSTSDTGSAVIMRDGWSDTEARAEDFEQEFRDSETEFLKLVLKMCDKFSDLALKVSDIEINFTRRNYENIVSKSNVLIQMLSNPKIAPQLAFQYCNMFPDWVKAWQISEKYSEEQQKKQLEMMNMVAGQNPEDPDNLNNPNDPKAKGPKDPTKPDDHGGGYNNVSNVPNDPNKAQKNADKGKGVNKDDK